MSHNTIEQHILTRKKNQQPIKRGVPQSHFILLRHFVTPDFTETCDFVLSLLLVNHLLKISIGFLTERVRSLKK